MEEWTSMRAPSLSRLLVPRAGFLRRLGPDRWAGGFLCARDRSQAGGWEWMGSRAGGRRRFPLRQVAGSKQSPGMGELSLHSIARTIRW